MTHKSLVSPAEMRYLNRSRAFIYRARAATGGEGERFGPHVSVCSQERAIRMVANFAKRQRRSLRSSYRRYRGRLFNAEAIPDRPRLARLFEYVDLLLVDHGFIRAIYLNLHEVAPGVWRSAQPSPRQIRKLKRRGLRTVVNLRGPRDCGSYRLERRVCEEEQVRFIDFKMRSRGVPKPEQVLQAAALFDEIDYPVLFHCKSGADRVGMIMVLYMMLRESRSLDEAMGQLSLRYGHFKQADTGVLDHFFECYRAETAETPMAFTRWVEESYEPKKVAASFEARGLINFLVDRVLRRE